MGIFGHDKDKLHLTETPDVHHITNPDVMHEESDVSIKGVGTFVGLLFLGLLIISGLMFGLFRALEKYAESKEVPPSPMARSERERLPPPGAPRLQGAPDHHSLDDKDLSFEKKEPTLEWDALSAKYKYDLENYHAADAGTGTMRIPIADAKRMLVEKNDLPVRQQSPQGTAGGIEIPTFMSAGRQTRKRDR